jgi:hypothetical protein
VELKLKAASIITTIITAFFLNLLLSPSILAAELDALASEKLFLTNSDLPYLKKTITVDLIELRDMLQLDGAYSRFSNLKARVIQPSIDQVNQYTDLAVTWLPIREKRAVVALKFKIAVSNQGELSLH